MKFTMGRCIAVASVLATGASQAQDFPTKPMRIIVGPGPDIVARMFGQKFTDSWGHQTIVEQRPGGGGVIATEMVAKAPPDGYTLLLSSAAYTINAALQPGQYDLVRDFSSIALCATSPFILSVHPSVPARSVKELIALAKSRPGQLVYSSSGNGTPPHLAGEMFKSMARVDILHVPYKYATPALVDVVSGQVQIMWPIMSISLPQVQAGKLRGLAVTLPTRSPVMPEYPTMAEAGVKGVVVINWYGILVPLSTPQAIIDRLAQATAAAMHHPDVIKRLAADGSDPATSTPAEFRKHIAEERDKWTRVIRNAGIKAQ